MSDTLTPDEVSRICLIVCDGHGEDLWTDGLPVPDVMAWLERHRDCDVEIHFDDRMGLVPTGGQEAT
ncbi:hypothetical protein [Catenuloplanes japonicus]|uniref:hypothetical protein n=1 Tax=Catenuloplanes japonicus TaxID=33876 RepID=UPI000526BDD8|nr:hypothetical protein [Catenuloplanes japonicus]